MENRKFQIGILALTATILFVGLIVVETVSVQPVYAGSMQDRGGDYSLTSMRVSSSKEVVWVIDARSRMAAVYMYDNNANSLVLRDRINIADLPIR